MIDMLAAQPEQAVADQIKVLLQVAKDKQEKCEKKFWKIRIGDEEVVIRDYFKCTLDLLGKVGDVAVQFAPWPGPIVWSAVKVLMQVRLRVA